MTILPCQRRPWREATDEGRQASPRGVLATPQGGAPDAATGTPGGRPDWTLRPTCRTSGQRAFEVRIVTVVGTTGSEETLHDGRVVTVRSLHGDDAPGVEVFWRRFDAPARRRFLDLAHLPPDDPGALASLRPGEEAGIVAMGQADSSARIVGLARYERTSGDAAEFLVFVDPAYRRVGLGIVLLRRLADAGASRRGAATAERCVEG